MIPALDPVPAAADHRDTVLQRSQPAPARSACRTTRQLLRLPRMTSATTQQGPGPPCQALPGSAVTALALDLHDRLNRQSLHIAKQKVKKVGVLTESVLHAVKSPLVVRQGGQVPSIHVAKQEGGAAGAFAESAVHALQSLPVPRQGGKVLRYNVQQGAQECAQLLLILL